MVSESLGLLLSTKMAMTPLIIDRFSIQNHRWKAENATYLVMVTNILLETPRCVYYAEYGIYSEIASVSSTQLSIEQPVFGLHWILGSSQLTFTSDLLVLG